ncbi:MAG: hypothetical protein LBH92_03365 [Bacteroidales bacterium]|jgi:hypothetical protein|nr:hypothetical protein [Bacteroidales bacterium]
MKKMFFAICLFFAVLGVNAQSYNHSVGLTVGFIDGVNYKCFIGSNVALSADLGYNFRSSLSGGFHFNPNIMYQNRIARTPLEWFAGGGISLGSAQRSFMMGLNAMGGIEYNFKAPLILGTDIRLGPGFEFRNKVNAAFLLSWNIFLRYRF